MKTAKAHSIFLFLFALVTSLLASCAEPLLPTLDVSPASRTLVTGETAQLTVTRHFPGGAVEDVTNKVAYTTTDKLVATVGDRGTVTAGIEVGAVLVKVYDASSDATGVATFTVVPPIIDSIELSPSPAIVMTRGTTRQFSAIAHFSNGITRDVSAQVLWSSTNEAAASVGNTQLDKGVVSAVAAGDTTILATDAMTHVQGRSIVFVTGAAAQLEAILVTPNPGIVSVGRTTPFQALGVLSDGTTHDITRDVTWSSSRTDVATIDATGLAVGVLAGDTTITAVGAAPSTAIRGSAAAKIIP